MKNEGEPKFRIQSVGSTEVLVWKPRHPEGLLPPGFKIHIDEEKFAEFVKRHSTPDPRQPYRKSS